MTKINVTDIVTNNATCSTINDMDMDIDMASYVAADVASNMADDVAFLEKPSPLVRGFILKLGH